MCLIGGGGGFGGDRGGGGDMVTQEDTVFIQGMNPSTTEDELCQHFGAIGIIKVHSFFKHILQIDLVYFTSK